MGTMRPMNLARALNIALDATPPDWVQLLHAGPNIVGTDGRAWILDDPAALVTAIQQRGKSLVIDWEHASEHRAPRGLDAPAAGWIDSLEVRDGAIWGHVEWTPRAAQQIRDREYRYLSPVFSYEKAGGRIRALNSAGLTNQPNLPLKALNREESPMPLPAALCRALDLPEAASESDAVTAVTAIRQRLTTVNAELATALNRADTPPLEKFVPRGDYDAALARATNAEQQLQTLQTQQRAEQVDALITKALNAGQITPATQDYYKAMCQTEGGIAEFEKFIAKAPALVGGESGLGGKPPGSPSGALTDTQKAICQSMGINPADYAKNIKEAAA